MHYYTRHLGDYAKDTRHLSLIEHGALTVLLDFFYASERALPESEEELFRLCGAIKAQEQDAVRRVMRDFFPGGRNGRAVKEIAKFREKSAKAAASVALRGVVAAITDVERTLNGRCSTDHPSLLDGSSSDQQRARASTNQQPTTNTQEPSTISPAPAGVTPDQVQAVYAAYPRKVGRMEAVKSIAKALANYGFPKVLAATQAYAQSRLNEDPQFTPHPSTWFNQLRFLDPVERFDVGKNGAKKTRGGAGVEGTPGQRRFALERELEGIRERQAALWQAGVPLDRDDQVRELEIERELAG